MDDVTMSHFKEALAIETPQKKQRHTPGNYCNCIAQKESR